MAAPAKPRNNFTQDIQESCVILIVVKDRFLAITSGSHMIKRARILDARAMTLCYNIRGIDALLDLTLRSHRLPIRKFLSLARNLCAGFFVVRVTK